MKLLYKFQYNIHNYENMTEEIPNLPGHWMATHTGRKIDPGTMTKDDVDIEDIAWSLSHLCRYNGHCDHFYSVAQHSVYVSEIVQSLGGDPKKGLLHDATECYVGDVVRPVKHRTDMENYVILENRVMRIIGEAFNFSTPIMTSEVSLADDIVLLSEKDQILKDSPDWGWGNDIIRMEGKIKIMYPQEAYKFFMNRYNELFNII